MAARRAAYFAFVRSCAAAVFKPDGSYQPATETDGRIAYWILPAFLASDDAAEREFGLSVYRAGAGWTGFDIFMTSCVAAHLVRHGHQLDEELRRRSEDHLARFTVAGDGRLPSAGIYDYMFHGYNDNMPAMATRTLIFAGDVLGRPDFTDQGLFHLEGLCAHLQRRGMVSEHTSATYTPILLASLLDIAECSVNGEARELAQACADRVFLDLLGHWHWPTGTTGNTMARAYTVDHTETLSVLNAYVWYLSGHPMTIDPCQALAGTTYDGPMHHGRNKAFNLAQFVEVMLASHQGIEPQRRAFAKQPRVYPYTIRATADWSESGSYGGCRSVQTRSYQQPQWWLATSSTSYTGGIAGQALLFHGALATTPQPQGWQDRVAFWAGLLAGDEDYGTPTRPDASLHAGAFAKEVRDECAAHEPLAEADSMNDCGRYHTVQKEGSAMLIGGVSPCLDGRDITSLRFSVFITAQHRMPDEVFENDEALAQWEGVASPKTWQFLRYGEVYLAFRLSGASHGARMPVRRVLRNGYLRLEMALIEGAGRQIDQAFREMTDFGVLAEMGSQVEAGSFAEFRRSVLATTWEFNHNFYRNSLWMARSGELQIIDSAVGGTARFIAIDGTVEPETHFAATGLDSALVPLFPDGRRIRQRRTLYRPDCVDSPFYKRPSQILESDRSF